MTVKELIQQLQGFDQNKAVVIRDADTRWALNIQTVTGTDYVEIAGDYGDEYDYEPVTSSADEAEAAHLQNMRDGLE